jgi:hypothetical protein
MGLDLPASVSYERLQAPFVSLLLKSFNLKR